MWAEKVEEECFRSVVVSSSPFSSTESAEKEPQACFCARHSTKKKLFERLRPSVPLRALCRGLTAYQFRPKALITIKRARSESTPDGTTAFTEPFEEDDEDEEGGKKWEPNRDGSLCESKVSGVREKK